MGEWGELRSSSGQAGDPKVDRKSAKLVEKIVSKNFLLDHLKAVKNGLAGIAHICATIVGTGLNPTVAINICSSRCTHASFMLNSGW